MRHVVNRGPRKTGSHGRGLRTAILAALLAAAMAAAPSAWALGERPIVGFDMGKPGVLLAADGRAARLVLDPNEHAGVRRAAADLQDDIARVSGQRPALLQALPGAGKGARKGADGTAAAAGDLVLVGTLGKSALIDRLAREGRIDAKALRGKWEGYLVQVVRNPLPGVARALVVAGSDKRGTIFGLYTLSEQIGVSPWHWWADVPAQRHAVLSVADGTRVTDAPVVRYRGIFLNDEAPALSGWAREKFGGFNARFYEKVFNLILRMRANYLWPAMWGNAFYDDDAQNGRLAEEMGVVIGTSHHEPMMRAHAEWARYGKGPWDYHRNERALRDFWQQGLRRSSAFERVITLGMRGDGDEPMSEESNVALLQRIVGDQRAMIAQETGKPLPQVPQLWALYKEVQDYYEKGMRVPDDVTLLWCDDNWGNIRRLPTREERKRSGGAGIYYHFDYVGGPRSYKWINVTPLPKVWEQMHQAWRHGADRLWIVNVGDLKPMEVPTEFFLNYAWNPAAWPAARLPDYLTLWATREFGAQFAGEVAALVEGYARYNGRRKPEQLAPDTYSLVDYRESERVVADYNGLAERARALAARLPAEKRDAFFQLVQYPVEASANLNELYATVGRNRLHAAQGRGDTGALATRAQALFARDAALARRYQQDIAGGKWNHMMAQTHIGYTGWRDPETDIMPEVQHAPAPAAAGTGLGVAVEGSTAAWPAASLRLPALDPFAVRPTYVEVFNRGGASLPYTVRADQPWVVLGQAGGTLAAQQPAQRIDVGVDWARAPRDARAAMLTVVGADGKEVNVELPLRHAGQRPAAPAAMAGGAAPFVESGGVVAIEAEHHARALAPQGREWLRVPGLGHTLSGMTTLPAEAPAATLQDGMRLEYDVMLFEPGTVSVQATLAPTLKFRPGAGFRYAVSFDDEAPRIVDVHADTSLKHWETIVSDGVARFASEHAIARPGRHVLKFWALDAGLVLQRLVIDAGGLKPSYLGPEESARLP
ncbi:glycosyl hydrolase [Massilia forsythiae]|uniref:Glycosyl hydrolase n=1 Tax=Massilia forsythiae TaxID=2728020 RepID=A0A7Z2W069_9BURK|nr:glycosyl hydrolase 115 family protein [Massilia forsythiae]QJE02045.1 glycosyl hydrolase [Massilia forsythiae]